MRSFFGIDPVLVDDKVGLLHVLQYVTIVTTLTIYDGLLCPVHMST